MQPQMQPQMMGNGAPMMMGNGTPVYAMSGSMQAMKSAPLPGQWQGAPSYAPMGQVNVYSGEQRALHEMTPQEIAMAGFDPASVIGV